MSIREGLVWLALAWAWAGTVAVLLARLDEIGGREGDER